MNNSYELPPDINSVDNVAKFSQYFRRFRISSDTRMIETRADGTYVEIKTFWKTIDATRGSTPSRPMHQPYAQFNFLLEYLLKYAKAI